MKRDRCPIAIIGSGRAAVLHLEAYLRLWEREALPQIRIVLGQAIHPRIRVLAKAYPESVYFTTTQEMMKSKQPDSVVDICTPTATHRIVLEELYRHGFSRFLVEKPLVTTKEDLERICSLPIRLALMQNYLFSRATLRVLDLIQSGEILPTSMVSVFDKDRTKDSLAMRGFYNGEPPHVFTIELPHQLYLATAFLGPAHVVSACSGDMVLEGRSLPHHGAGMIQLEHGDAGIGCIQNPSSLHSSCLTSENPVRRVLLTSDDGKTLTVDFPTNQNDLTSRIERKDQTGSVHSELFQDDDMIKMALQHHYTALSQGTADPPPDPPDINRSTELIIEALQRSDALKGNSAPGSHAARNTDACPR